MESNYMICIDESGTPYLEHAWGKKASVKYIAKIGEGAKARYFYTQDQLRAFQQGAKQSAQQKQLQRKAENYNKNKAKETKKKEQRDKIKEKTNKVKNDIKEKTGINAKERYEKAKGEATDAARAYKQTVNAKRETGDMFDNAHLEATRNLNRKNYDEFDAKYDYYRTPLGKIDAKLNGKDTEPPWDYGSGTTNEKTTKQMNNDWDIHELELNANRAKLTKDTTPKEYTYALGSNTGHTEEVSDTIKAEAKMTSAEINYKKARNEYNKVFDEENKKIFKDKEKLKVLKEERDNKYKDYADAKDTYDKKYRDLIEALNKDIDNAKDELNKAKKKNSVWGD